MKSLNLLRVLLFIALSGCTTRHAGIVVSSVPENHAWWLRTEFVPVHKQVRGIPLPQLDSSWDLASELTKDIIPKELLYEDGSDIMEENEVCFSRSDDFNHDGVEDLALIGVYKGETGKRGSFLLILTRDQTGNWRKSFLESFGNPAFAALSKKGPLVIWFCMYCDFGADVVWDNDRGKYLLNWSQDEER
ncbi:MAG: hypothetical protein AB1724_05295 [Thermodesulfobacteriota bacterium]